MKIPFTFLVLLLGAMLAAPCLIALDSVPKLVNYQGKLTNSSGQALADGTYKLRFCLYSKKDSSQAGDTLVWGSEYNVTVVSGQFNVVLGAAGGTAVAGAAVNDIGFAFADPERYLQMTVLTDSTGVVLTPPQVLSPRQQLLASPYALQAQNGIPVGGVILWWGPKAQAQLPAGFELCDGTAPATTGALLTGLKPNLLDRFPKGATAGATNTQTGNVFQDTNQTLAVDVTGTSLTIAQMPSHQHEILPQGAGSNPQIGNWLQGATGGTPYGNLKTGWTGGTSNGSNGAAHTHTVPAHDNRPAFLEMFYIIRVK